MRESWTGYLMGIAHAAAARSTCPRASVGCVIAQEYDIVATGYNGSPPTAPHCIDVDCLMIDNACKRTIHAEVNAVIRAARSGVSIKGATAFVTHYPCAECLKVLAGAGILEIWYDEPYRIDRAIRQFPEHASIMEMKRWTRQEPQ